MGTALTFDAELHSYQLNGITVPSVTQVLRSVFPVHYYNATQWHMDRGTVVHQYAAMVAQGRMFAPPDVRIQPQVDALKSWFKLRKPYTCKAEVQLFKATPISYAGTCDLICWIDGVQTLVDWKASKSALDQWQIGGYADALQSMGVNVNAGIVVQIKDNGTFAETHIKQGSPIKMAINEWRVILSTYQLKTRESL